MMARKTYLPEDYWPTDFWPPDYWPEYGVPFDYIEQALYFLLYSNRDVYNLVGYRIYPMAVPESAAMPAITYQQISGAPDMTMSGEGDLIKEPYQFNCWATTYAAARDLANKVRIVLDGYKGTIHSLPVKAILLNDENDELEFVPELEDSRRHGKILEFTVWYKARAA